MYRLPSQSDQYFFNTLDQALGVYSNFENALLIGDFKAQIRESHLDTFLNQQQPANINKVLTYYKNSEDPSCTDFICPIDQTVFLK